MITEFNQLCLLYFLFFNVEFKIKTCVTFKYYGSVYKTTREPYFQQLDMDT